jgi:peptidoglycan/xylan/chitin deacetylase (PgdA/CDA1 family)
MTSPRDRFDYSAMPSEPPVQLPDNARVAVVIVVNVEEWDLQRAMPRGVLPPPGGATGIPDVPNWAWHEYGMRVGFWRLKAALDRYQIKATASINASVCLSYPDVAGAIRDDGWEFMGHGFTQLATNQVDDQREMVRKSVETIRNFTGTAPPRLAPARPHRNLGNARDTRRERHRIRLRLGRRRPTIRDAHRRRAPRVSPLLRRTQRHSHDAGTTPSSR